ncbi:CPBP family intramembrane metalloprotease [Companilactobacillus allii]|uniref:CAAX protease family protein n=1 Tax=Companilactobacillus allii TaxID=1847728 RepID=A0A1P8Q5K0_9LACO|nr:type II CAAX endopeptidase family protein [Companilactobacillus allii]APX73099.1 CAAX protease family protein [Companilactobacillus allii]USQ67900.1 CPBP family intramembrane metalloprotease [Companilactobacillus allii]
MNNKINTLNPIRGLLRIIAFILLFIAEQIPLSILTLTKKDLGPKYSVYLKVAPFVTLILLAIASFIIWLVFKRAQKFKSIKFNKSTWIIIIIATILVFAVNIITVPLMKTTNDNVAALELVGKNNMLILVFFTIIVAPILEEIIFRGIFMNWFFANNPLVSVLLSGIVFGYVHAPFSPNIDWIYALSKILLGIILAAVYYRTKNIKASITVHFLNNFLAIISGLI